MIKLSLVFAIVACLLGCTTPLGSAVKVPTNKDAEVMSIDDEKRVVRMGAPYLYLEEPTVDWSGARTEAAKVCQKRWGTDLVEPVGRTRRECLSELGSNCTRWAMIGDYKCLEK
ncbi:MAG: hypothetical protein GKR90_22060 [Pseudomonadales bacterium]|nr:hypothetical protein [Pseudomonadales bacterium]